MPRHSIGDIAMTGAERRARYRAARAQGQPVIRNRRPADRRSRFQRWNDTVASLVVVSGDVGEAPPLKHGVTSSLQRRGRRRSGALQAPVHPRIPNRGLVASAEHS
jgi:hypothetical protein